MESLLGDVMRERDQLGRRLSSLHEALAAASEETPIDAMLDFWNDLTDGVRGRLSRESVARVNEGLRELFETFILDTPRRVSAFSQCFVWTSALISWWTTESPRADLPSTAGYDQFLVTT